MAEFDYARSQATATRLIGRFGRDVTVSLEGDTPAGGEKDWRGSDTGSRRDRTVKGVLLDESLGRGVEIILEPTGARLLCSVPSDGLDLRDASAALVGGQEYRITESAVLDPAGIPVFYEFRVER